MLGVAVGGKPENPEEKPFLLGTQSSNNKLNTHKMTLILGLEFKPE